MVWRNDSVRSVILLHVALIFIDFLCGKWQEVCIGSCGLIVGGFFLQHIAMPGKFRQTPGNTFEFRRFQPLFENSKIERYNKPRFLSLLFWALFRKPVSNFRVRVGGHSVALSDEADRSTTIAAEKIIWYLWDLIIIDFSSIAKLLNNRRQCYRKTLTETVLSECSLNSSKRLIPDLESISELIELCRQKYCCPLRKSLFWWSFRISSEISNLISFFQRFGRQSEISLQFSAVILGGVLLMLKIFRSIWLYNLKNISCKSVTVIKYWSVSLQWNMIMTPFLN